MRKQFIIHCIMSVTELVNSLIFFLDVFAGDYRVKALYTSENSLY